VPAVADPHTNNQNDGSDYDARTLTLSEVELRDEAELEGILRREPTQIEKGFRIIGHGSNERYRSRWSFGSFNAFSCLGRPEWYRGCLFLGFEYETSQRLFDAFHESELVDDEFAD
jgi:hypothetical protein